jgi:hypothetical protein
MDIEVLVVRFMEFVIALSAVAAIFYKLFKRGVEQALDPKLDSIQSELSDIKIEVQYNSGKSLKDKVRQLDIKLASLGGQLETLMEMMRRDGHS